LHLSEEETALLFEGAGLQLEQFSIREDSDALLRSSLYNAIARLMAQHEHLDKP
jgi:hypothetical protein